VHLSVEGTCVTVTVREGGEGPSRADDARATGGLGLAMVRSVSRALGGSFAYGTIEGGFEARVRQPAVVDTRA